MIINYTQDSWRGRASTEIIEKHRENIEIYLFLIAGRKLSIKSSLDDRITKFEVLLAKCIDIVVIDYFEILLFITRQQVYKHNTTRYHEVLPTKTQTS